MNLRELIQRFVPASLLVAFIIVEFDFLAKVPIPSIHEWSHTAFVAINLVFLGYYVLYMIRSKQVSRMFLFILPIVALPFITAWQAYENFGQPFIYGVLAERGKFFAISGLMLVHFLERGWWTIELVKKTVVTGAFLFFAFMLSLYLFVNPELFEGTNFVINSVYRGYRYGMNQAFVVFLFLYALFKALDTRNNRWLFLLVSILFYLFVFHKGRSLLLATVGAAAIFLFRNYSSGAIIKYFLGIAVGGIVVLLGSWLVVPEIFKTNVLLFASAFNAIFGGEVVDGSAASRITQVQIAIDGINQHPLMGNGFLSSRWQEGFAGKFGHFYPSDIGWFGVFFLYGGLGWLILMSPFFLAFSFRKALLGNNDIFLVTCQAMTLYFFIHNISAAFVVKKYGMIMFLFGIIYYYRYVHKQPGEAQAPEPVKAPKSLLPRTA